MLHFPIKPAVATSEELGNGLTTVIRTTYGMFAAAALTSDSVAFRRAREAAVGKKKVSNETEAAAMEGALVIYCAMLDRLQEALGTEVREQKAMAFAWTPSWEPSQPKPVRHYDVLAERAPVLFNLAACWSMRGALPPRSDSDAIKAAARHFQLAAGALKAVQDLSPESGLEPTCAPELTDGALSALRALMVAQAQACFCDKAASDSMGAGTQAMLALGAKQLYALAAEAFASLQSSKPHAKLHAWGAAVCVGRKQWYEAEARWQQATDAASANKYGEQQAQLQLGLTAANAALATLGSAQLESPSALSKLSALASKTAATLAGVTKDNQLVYNERVPDAAELPEVAPKVLAKALPVDTLVSAALDAPFPASILRPGEEGSGELVRSWLARLGTEFVMIPLHERGSEAGGMAALADASAPGGSGEAGGAASKETSSGSKAEGSAESSSLSRFFGKSSSSGSGLHSSGSGLGGGADDGHLGTKRDADAKKESKPSLSEMLKAAVGKDKPGSGISVKVKGSKAKGAAAAAALQGSDLDDDTALQRALEESLKESGKELYRTVPAPSPRSPSAPMPPPPPSAPPVARTPSRDLLSRNLAASAPPTLPPPPSFEEAAMMPSAATVEALVAKLMAMGFSRDRCLSALRDAKFDVNAAGEALLS